MNNSLFDPIDRGPTNSDLLNIYNIPQEVPPTQNEEFDNLTDNELIDSINELYSYLTETLIRFNASPEFSKKSDFKILLKTLVNSLIYLYRYLPDLVRLLTSFINLEDPDNLTVVENLSVLKHIIGKLIISEDGFVKQGSSNEEVLLGEGGTKTLQSIYDRSAEIVKEYSDYTLDLLNETILVKEDTEAIRQLAILDLNQIKSEAEDINDETNTLKIELNQIKSEAEDIKDATNTIRIETDQIKSDVQQIKDDTNDIKSGTQDIFNDVEQLAGSIIGSGAPRGVYNTLQDLISEDPNHQYIYVVLDEGNWYYWSISNNEWISGGPYQAPVDDYYNTISQILIDIQTLQNSKVFISANEYQILLDNDLIIPDVEYNIYEDDN